MARSKYVEYQGFAVPPGETIKQWLIDTGTSQAELGRRANIPSQYIQKLITGRAGLTVDMALRIEQGTEAQLSARLLLRIEVDYRLTLARIALQDGKRVSGHGKQLDGGGLPDDPDGEPEDRSAQQGSDDQ